MFNLSGGRTIKPAEFPFLRLFACRHATTTTIYKSIKEEKRHSANGLPNRVEIPA